MENSLKRHRYDTNRQRLEVPMAQELNRIASNGFPFVHEDQGFRECEHVNLQQVKIGFEKLSINFKIKKKSFSVSWLCHFPGKWSSFDTGIVFSPG